MHIMQRDEYEQHGIFSMNRCLLSKLRSSLHQQQDQQQQQQQIPTTALSIGSLDRGSVDDSCGSSFKKNPWYVASAPLDISGPKRKRGMRELSASLDESEIVLALGNSPNSVPNTALALGQGESLENKSSPPTRSFDFERSGRFSAPPCRNFGGLRLGLSSSSEDSHSVGSEVMLGLGHAEPSPETLLRKQAVLVDEGSSSARWIKNGGVMPALLQQQQQNQQHDNSDSEDNFISDDAEDDTGMMTPQSEKVPKVCKFEGGCGKGARGASGLCIAHGGGRRCQKEGCSKGAEGRTVYCKAHGGGRRCHYLGCTKSAEGKTDYCISHGGGRRCSHETCGKAARGRSGLCIRHGGGKRCQREGCTKSAEGFSGLCISHGGGRRCQAPECTKGAQGSTMFCKAHGGGKRCMMEGCGKGAEGSTPLCKAHGGGKRCMYNGGGCCSKSVHGGTQFCVAHGGGKRCGVQGCPKSARGRTAFCVKHGGGKRCQVEACGKSAQGSTDFCKAHGGGKRCIWGQEGSPYADSRGLLGSTRTSCDRFARGKLGLCAAHSSLVQDDRLKHSAGVFVKGLASQASTLTSAAAAAEQPVQYKFLEQWTGIESRSNSSSSSPWQPTTFVGGGYSSGFSLIPSQVNSSQAQVGEEPEGRVHGGGGLLALLGQAKG